MNYWHKICCIKYKVLEISSIYLIIQTKPNGGIKDAKEKKSTTE
jgi:hypothetical protein